MKLEDIKLDERVEVKPNIIIDTGLGGLRAFKELSEKYPVENFVFYCDNEILPIGNKDSQQMLRRISRMVKRIKLLNPKSIIIACNTIDAIAGDVIESSFPTVKVIRIISTAVKKAEECTKTKEIALLATTNTINSQRYMDYFLLYNNTHVFGIDCPNMCYAIENNQDVKTVFEQEVLMPLKTIEFDTIILGCTHYYKIKGMLLKNFKNIEIVDSVEEVISKYDQEFEELINNRADIQKRFIIFTKEDKELEKKYSEILLSDSTFLVDKI